MSKEEKVEEKRRAVEEILRWYIQNGARKELDDELREKLAEVLDVVTFAPLQCQDNYCDYLVGFFELEDPSRIYDVLAGLRFLRSGSLLDYVEVEEHVNVDEDRTPLAATITERVNWRLVRPVWQAQVEKVIEEIAAAEWNGTLRETLPAIFDSVKKSRWIYEFQHLYSVLKNTAMEFGIALNE